MIFKNMNKISSNPLSSDGLCKTFKPTSLLKIALPSLRPGRRSGKFPILFKCIFSKHIVVIRKLTAFFFTIITHKLQEAEFYENFDT